MTPELATRTSTRVREIGALVRRARKQARLTQAQAAARCGVGTRFLSELENGKPTVHLDKVLQVLEAFNLQIKVSQDEFSSRVINV
jgi:HTH-type transcriptional regulator / antitoxin HipB